MKGRKSRKTNGNGSSLKGKKSRKMNGNGSSLKIGKGMREWELIER